MEKRNKFVEFMTQSFGAVGKYILGKLVAGTIITVVAGLVLRMLGIKGAFWLGAVMGIGNLVPIFGVWVGILISTIVVLIQTIPEEPLLFLAVIGIGIVLQVLDEFVITPIVVGKAIDLKPIVIIAAVYIGGMLIPFWGLIIAVPVAAIIKIAYNVFIKKKEEPEKVERGEKQEKVDGGEV